MEESLQQRGPVLLLGLPLSPSPEKRRRIPSKDKADQTELVEIRRNTPPAAATTTDGPVPGGVTVVACPGWAVPVE